MALNRGDVLVVTLEAAMGADLTADPNTWTWTDLSSRTMGTATIVRGRADEAQQTQPSSLTIRLGNTDSALTPRHPMSRWYQLWKRGTPVRLKVTIPGDATYTRFQGRVTAIKPIWPSGNSDVAFVDVTAKGALYNLQQGSPPLRSPLYRAITALGPLAHWVLDDGSNAAWAGSALPGGAPLAVSNQVKFASLTTPGGDQAPEIIGGKLTGTCPTGVSTTGFSIHFAARMVKSDPAQSSEIWPLSVQSADGRLWTWDMWDYTGGSSPPDAFVGEQSPPLPAGSAATEVRSPGGFTPFDGQWHSYLMVATKVSSTTVMLEAYADGRSCSGTTVNGAVTFAPIGGPITIPDENTHAISRIASLSLDHVAIYDRALGQAEAQQLASATLGWAGETAGNRIRRLCGEQSIAFPSTAPTTLLSEGFESSTLGITVTGTWARDSTQFHSGAWSYTSATIADGATTDTVVTVPAGATSMTVWYKVSSQTGWHYFQIWRDGVQDLRASGEMGWTQRTINVVGVSQVTFRYTKVFTGHPVAGLDAAWIDDIVFTKDNDLTAALATAKMGTQRADTLYNLLRQCEDADQGILTDGLTAGLTYIAANSRYNQSVALALDANRAQIKWPPFDPIEDDQRLRTKYFVSRINGSSATFTDPSAATEGEYLGQANLNLADDTTLADQTSWRTHLFTVPEMRTPVMAIDVRNSPELLPSWLVTDIGERYTAANPPVQYPPGGLDLVLEQYTETIDGLTWRVQLTGSPFAPWRVFVLDADRLDADSSSQLVAGITATATTFQVQTAAAIPGALWTTSSAEWTAPKTLYIGIAGEQMQVTNITGASSPQTFTVIRSVNGVVKAQAANTRVGLWQPRVLAL